MHYNCLIVDDEEELAKATCEYFQMFDTSCAWVSNAADCEAFLQENRIDVLLLDINLGDDSGFQLCKKLRETSDVPILFISARQSDDDVLIALNIGGDDYIKKPYTLSVLLAKVKVIIKRNNANMQKYADEKQYVSETDEKQENQRKKAECNLENVHTAENKFDIELNPQTRSVVRRGQQAQLKAKEYQLFSYLYENANRIITKDELFNAVWGDAFFSDGTLNVHIRKLREKLEDNPNEPQMIKTIWGTGYMLEL